MWRAAAQFKEVQTKLMDSVDAEEGVASFVERRAAPFTGR